MEDAGLLRRFKHIFISFQSTIYIPHLDYGDAIYDQPLHPTSSSKIKSVHYHTALAITETIRSLFHEFLPGVMIRTPKPQTLGEKFMLVLQSPFK